MSIPIADVESGTLGTQSASAAAPEAAHPSVEDTMLDKTVDENVLVQTAVPSRQPVETNEYFRERFRTRE